MTRLPWARTLPDVVSEWSARTPDAQAVVAESGQRLSYAGLERSMARIASAFAACGVRPGSTVGLLAANVAEWIPAALGAMAAGARVAAFNTFVKPLELTYLLEHSQCTTLVAAGRAGRHNLLPTLQQVLPELWAAEPGRWLSPRFPALRSVVLVGEDRPPGAEPWAAFSTDDVPAAATDRDAAGPSAVDDAVVVYTSGSTARPKAVPLAHYGLVENGHAIGERMQLTGTDRVWLGSPLFWSYGVANAMMATLTHGACLVLQTEYSPDAAAALIGREACTAAYLLPTILHDLVSLPTDRRSLLASLETGLTIGRSDEVELAVHLGIDGICNVYGATEVYDNCCVTPRDMPLDRRLECQGPPLPGVEIRLSDPDTGAPANGSMGMIEVRGYTTLGYLGDAELTAKAFTPDGWYRSGDLGVLLPDGSLRFLARATDMIKTSGINVSPAEVEEFLNLHPQVAESLVVGAPDEQRGEVVVAIVRPAAGAEVHPQELIAYCRQNIAAYKVPVRIVVVDEFPLTDTGKIARLQARALAAGAVG